MLRACDGYDRRGTAGIRDAYNQTVGALANNLDLLKAECKAIHRTDDRPSPRELLPGTGSVDAPTSHTLAPSGG